MSIDFRSYLLYGHKLGDAKVDEKIKLILDEEVGSIGGVDLDDLMDDWCFITEDEIYIAVPIAKACPDEFVKVLNLSKALEKSDCKLQEFYIKIGGFDYLETNVDKLILFSDLGY